MLSATLRHTDIETHLTLHLNNAISRHNVLDTLFISTYTLVNIVCATIQKFPCCSSIDRFLVLVVKKTSAMNRVKNRCHISYPYGM